MHFVLARPLVSFGLLVLGAAIFPWFGIDATGLVESGSASATDKNGTAAGGGADQQDTASTVDLALPGEPAESEQAAASLNTGSLDASYKSSKAVAVPSGSVAIAADGPTAATPGEPADSLSATLPGPSTSRGPPAELPAARPLVRSGRLVIEGDHISRVHTRFSGQVVALGRNELAESVQADSKVAASSTPGNKISAAGALPRAETAPILATPSGGASHETAGGSDSRPFLRHGDPVRRGQVLAVIWSKEVGEKKHELANALMQLHRDQRLANQSGGPAGASRAERFSEADMQIKADQLAIDRIERTLHLWQISEEEIREVRAEVTLVQDGQPAARLRRDWAEVQICSPLDGVVLEANVSRGEMVDKELELFKVADLSTLTVAIDIYEEDLPIIESLPPHARCWTVHLPSDPGATAIAGTFDVVDSVFDPLRHTICATGRLDNHNGFLQAGQFVTAEIAVK